MNTRTSAADAAPAQDARLIKLFAAHGPLGAQVEGFAPRPQQLELADAILRAIESSSTLVVEAGTGIGKTFAYLVPAFLAGGKVIISTGTKTLQDQLYERDVPAVRKLILLLPPVTSAPVTTISYSLFALLSNYVYILNFLF